MMMARRTRRQWAAYLWVERVKRCFTRSRAARPKGASSRGKATCEYSRHYNTGYRQTDLQIAQVSQTTLASFASVGYSCAPR